MQWDGYWDKEKVAFVAYEYSSGSLAIKAEMIVQESHCPVCGKVANSVHSHYERTIADLPCFGASCHISLSCRRFFCRNEACKRQVFCERLGAVAKAYARKSSRLMTSLYAISFRLAANAASQLGHCLGMQISSSRINSYIRAFAHPTFKTPRVLGIDDWSMAKGRSYGTLLVDLEKQQPIELLEGRDAETLAGWLKQHPDVEIISRDRSGEYGLAISQAAPQAIDIADRWHLLKNLREMVERYFQSKAEAIELAYERTLAQKSSISVPEPSLSSRKKLEKEQKRVERLSRYKAVHKLHKEGTPKIHIARQLGLSRGTVIRFLNTDTFPEQQTRASQLGRLKPFTDYINQQFSKGCHNINQLWRDVQARGYDGKRAMVKRYVHYLKSLNEEQLQALAAPIFRKPTPKRLSYALLKPIASLSATMQLMLTQLADIANDFDEFKAKTTAFNTMIKERRAATFVGWLEQTSQSSIVVLKNFAISLKRDQEAIHNAMKYPWSNGQLEGQVNRLKTIKRQMYGRAKFDLLKARVLYDSS